MQDSEAAKRLGRYPLGCPRLILDFGWHSERKSASHCSLAKVKRDAFGHAPAPLGASCSELGTCLRPQVPRGPPSLCGEAEMIAAVRGSSDGVANARFAARFRFPLGVAHVSRFVCGNRNVPPGRCRPHSASRHQAAMYSGNRERARSGNLKSWWQ